MKVRLIVTRGVELVTALAREFGRIPYYNTEGERLMRAMRNHNGDRPVMDRIRVVRARLRRSVKDRAVALSL